MNSNYNVKHSKNMSHEEIDVGIAELDNIEDQAIAYQV